MNQQTSQVQAGADFVQALQATQPTATATADVIDLQPTAPAQVASQGDTARLAVTSELTGFEGFGEAVAEAEGPQVKDDANWKVFFRKAEGKRKKLKGSTQALDFLYTIRANVSAAAEAADSDEEEESRPKKRGPKPKNREADQTTNQLHMTFYDDVGNAALNFLNSLRDQEEAYEIDLHLGGADETDSEVFTFENVSLVPMTRALTLHRVAGCDPDPLSLQATFTYSRVTRSAE